MESYQDGSVSGNARSRKIIRPTTNEPAITKTNEKNSKKGIGY